MEINKALEIMELNEDYDMNQLENKYALYLKISK